jgi:NADPH:quinone reductase-like Zn-dependent oxidoreductase
LGTARAAAAVDARLCSVADGGPGVTTVFARPDTGVLDRLMGRVEAGSLRVTVAASFALKDAAIAQDALTARTCGPGKIILIPDRI